MFAFAASLRVALGTVSDPAASADSASACSDSTGTSGRSTSGVAGVACGTSAGAALIAVSVSSSGFAATLIRFAFFVDFLFS